METFSKEEMNSALLGMYVGTRGPKTLRKCITDKLFTYQMWRNEESIRERLDAEMVLLVFPESKPVPSLDELDDIVIQDISSLAFALSKNEQDISKLRNSIQGMLEGPIFYKYLQSREQQFRRKNSSAKLLSRIQFAKLYPENEKSNIYELDISLLCFILFEGMGFRPISDCDKLPLESVITEADDMLRIKICRNILVYQINAEMSDEEFNKYWECLTGAFERLLKSTSVRRESERLKSLRLPDEKIDQFKAMVQGWRDDEQDERIEREEQELRTVTNTDSHTYSVIKANGTNIVDNLNEKHEELASLFKKNSSKRRKVQNKELKKSFPLRVHGYDKFKQVCHIMHEVGIKYTLPITSTTDTTLKSDSSSSPKNSDRGVLQFEVDSEDVPDKTSLNLRRSRSLPRYRPKQCDDISCRASDTTSNLNSSVDSATDHSKVLDTRPQRQWKRNLSEKCRSSPGNRSPRSGNSIRMGVRSFDEVKLTVCNSTTNPEVTDVEHDSTDEYSTRQLDPLYGTGSHGRMLSDQLMESTEDVGDPTGYFLSLQRRDEYIHSPTEIHHIPENTYGNVFQIIQTRTKNSPTDTCLSNLEEEEDNTSLSATSGEYVLEEEGDENPTKRVSVIGEKVRLSSIKSGMYSEDSTGYNTDLLTLNSSVDGNTSSDTLLFQPVRLPTAHTSPTCGIHGTWAPLAKGKGEQVFHLSISPRAHPNATDDGYASNGYFSSLDRDSSTTPDQFRMIDLQNTVHDNTTEPFVYREDPNSQEEEAHNKELNLNTEAETLLDRTVSKKQNGFSISSCFKSCLFCGVEVPDTDQEKSIIVSDNYRQRRESERHLLSSCNSTASTDVSGRVDSIQLSESQHTDRGLRIGYDTDNRSDELEEIFV